MFDKIKFAKILSDINTTYNTMTEFAEKTGVNRTYLSQYINLKLDSPPSPKILMKIANTSNKTTSYEELMLVCGYIEKDMQLSEISKKIFNKHLPSLKKLNLSNDLLDIIGKMSVDSLQYSKDFETLVDQLPKETQNKIYTITYKILDEITEIKENSINNIELLAKYDIQNSQQINDPLGLAQIGFSMKDYEPPTETQKEQIRIIIETILKDNKKDTGDKK